MKGGFFEELRNSRFCVPTVGECLDWRAVRHENAQWLGIVPCRESGSG
jgi:hypothetical protein